MDAFDVVKNPDLINKYLGQMHSAPRMFSGKYPWTNMKPGVIRDLMQVDPNGPRFEWSYKNIQDESGDLYRVRERWLVNDSAGGLTRWLQGGRRLVNITSASFDLLSEQECRLDEIPLCRDDKPWRLGYMFQMNRRDLTDTPRDVPFLFYIEPSPSSVGRGVQICGWIWNEEPPMPEDLKRHKNRVSGWVPIGFSVGRDAEGQRVIRGYDIIDTLSDLKAVELGYTPLETRIQIGNQRRVAINALASLHALPDVRVLMNPAKKGKRKSTVGGLRGVKRLTLNEKGTRISMTRRIHEEKHTRQSSTRTVGLHHVGQHHWRVWVNTPKAHEHILATRTKTNSDGETYTQFRVRRLRGPKSGYVRGSGPLKVKKSDLVTGIDDFGGE